MQSEVLATTRRTARPNGSAVGGPGCRGRRGRGMRDAGCGVLAAGSWQIWLLEAAENVCTVERG